MSEENKTAEQVEPMPEDLEARKKMQSAVAAFLADPRHERYVRSTPNQEAIRAYFEERDLECTEESMHSAFVDLSKEGNLALYEESKLQPESAKPEPAADKLPPIGVATGEDLGIGIVQQQQARRNTPVAGVRPSNNRDAFIQAARDASTVNVKSQRFHL